jgi:glucose-1-phosphate thymidylyltransferase
MLRVEVRVKGIVLAGGTGSRLRPITRAVCKQLLPVYDKPMIYYPLTTLMLAGVRELLVVTTSEDRGAFERLLGDGSAWGVHIRYAVQQAPRGIAEALLLGEAFLDGGPCALVLGDNLLYGHGLTDAVQAGAALERGALVFGHLVADPARYGVLAMEEGRVVDIVEKPTRPPSRYAVPGLYFYGPDAPARARALRPSARGELEITDLNRSYLADGLLDVRLFGRGLAWLDMGTPDALASASVFVQTLQERQGLRIGCPEEVAWRQGFIDDAGLRAAAAASLGTGYGEYLIGLLEAGA